MNTITVQRIKREGKRLTYSYTVSGDWKRFFQSGEPMWVEYDASVSHVPDSVAVLPLVGNVLVLASLMNATIYLDEIDRDFYECVEECMNGFETIMPDHVHFKKAGLIEAQKLITNVFPAGERERNLLFFSGGVDATSSLITHLDENPVLVNIWGADVPWYEEKAWAQAVSFNQQVADRYGLDLRTIRSNFRFSLDDTQLDPYCMALVQDWWWSAFHHNIAMMCLAAPLAYQTSLKLYFAGTYYQTDETDWGGYITASDPAVDDHVRFCGCQVVHDGYEYSRYRKIERIVQFYSQQQKPFLRVCYQSNTGKNCGRCEKCASAIMTLRLLGVDPAEYGFSFDEEQLSADFAAGLQEMARAEKYAFLSFYTDVQAAYRKAIPSNAVPKELRIFYDTDLKTLADFLHVPCNELLELHRSRAAYDQRQNARTSAIAGKLKNVYHRIRRDGWDGVLYYFQKIQQHF